MINADTPVEKANDNLLNVPRIENWYTTSLQSPYIPPELRTLRVSGIIFGDTRGRFRDGDPILTSNIIGATGKFITTHSGSVYELGTPDVLWLQHLQDRGIVFNPEQPIRIHTIESASGVH